MLSISNEFELSLGENSNQLIKGTIRFADKTTRELTGDDIVACSFDQQVSSEGSFDVGTAIIGQMDITLNNHDGRFDTCDFTGSMFKAWVGKELSSGTEWIQRGLYTANQPDAYNGTIAISALDSLSKFEVPFSDFAKATGLPLNDSVSVREVIGNMCRYCGVKWDEDGNSALNRSFCFEYVDQNATCRQVLAYCCQVCCVNASAAYNGHLRTVWYDTSVFESEDDCDGGVFDSESPYSTGASKDGGDFLDYSSGDFVDGGTFITNRSVHQLYAFSNVTVNTDDVVITGVRVSERSVTENNETINGETVQIGDDGYVLSISNNPLVLPGFGRDVAELIAGKVIGMRFRPFSGKHICVPSIEAGDCAYVIDRKQNMHRSYVTRVKYTVNGGMAVSCGAKSASRNSADNAGASTSAYVKARNEIQRELSERDLAIKSLGESLADAKGMYHTEVKKDDGSIVYYLHDKPTTDQSKIIYKIAADGIGISTDSGKTYATGLTADGDAILKRIYAIGINADYVRTGRLTAQNGDNFFDLDTGQARFALESGTTIGGNGIVSTAEAVKSAVPQYSQGTSAVTQPDDGWSEVCPHWKSGYYVWFRIVTVMADGSQLVGSASCISGRNGMDGRDGIDGTDGKDGAPGKGIRSSEPQWYLSSSSDEPTDGEWLSSCPDWTPVYYYFTRLCITWDDGSQTYTDPVEDTGLTKANIMAFKSWRAYTSIDQQKIFNILTDGGKAKGIFTSGGQLYFNADYIHSGTIDASIVGIKNLLKVGGDESNVTIGSSAINFKVDGDSSALSLETVPYSVERSIFMDSGQDLFGGSTSFNRVFTMEKPIGKDVNGKTWYSISFSVAYNSGIKTIRKAGYVDAKVGQKTVWMESNMLGPWVYFNLNSNSDGSLSMSVTLHKAETRVQDTSFYALSVSYWSDNSSGTILSGDGAEFLTSKNYPSLLNDGDTFSGEISIPFIYGNTMRNYNLYFENGILVKHELLTPSDPGFK